MRNYKNIQPEKIFQALADSTRLRLLTLLLHHEKELCCCELSDSLHIPEYAVSRHIKILQYSGLVEARKEGRWVYYRLSPRPGKFIQKTLQNLLLLKDIWKEDRKSLRKRLKLRQNGKCVLGPAHLSLRNKEK